MTGSKGPRTGVSGCRSGSWVPGKGCPARGRHLRQRVRGGQSRPGPPPAHGRQNQKIAMQWSNLKGSADGGFYFFAHVTCMPIFLSLRPGPTSFGSERSVSCHVRSADTVNAIHLRVNFHTHRFPSALTCTDSFEVAPTVFLPRVVELLA
jgi:hypothetical protein